MLVDYKQNLFATRANLTEALTQANDLYGNAVSSADSIAMRTAVHVVLNTAIQQHTLEMDALRDKHAAEVQALRSQLAARPDPVTALLGLVDERVNAALEKLDIDGRVDNFLTHNLGDKIGNAFADHFDAAVNSWADDNLSDKMDDWYNNNVDIADDVKRVLNDEIDLEDLVGEKVTSFFGNNSFSIEPR